MSERPVELVPSAQRVVEEILAERLVQIGRWGNEHDDRQSDAEWGNVLGAYLGYVQQSIKTRGAKPTEEAQMRYEEEGDEQLRVKLVKLATTAVAYVETLDRRASTTD